MRRLVIMLLVVSLSGCGHKTCVRPERFYNPDIQAYDTKQVEYNCGRDNTFRWYHVPLLIIAAPVLILFLATDSPSSSPHYQAGNAAAIDYTLPENQPQPQPTYQQQQISNGNGSGRYGNYPAY